MAELIAFAGRSWFDWILKNSTEGKQNLVGGSRLKSAGWTVTVKGAYDKAHISTCILESQLYNRTILSRACAFSKEILLETLSCYYSPYKEESFIYKELVFEKYICSTSSLAIWLAGCLEGLKDVRSGLIGLGGNGQISYMRP